MAEYRIRILKAAARDLARLDKPIARRIVQRIKRLATSVDAMRLEALTGDLAGLYKLRVGNYRIIYEVLWDEKIVTIHLPFHSKVKTTKTQRHKGTKEKIKGSLRVFEKLRAFVAKRWVGYLYSYKKSSLLRERYQIT